MLFLFILRIPTVPDLSKDNFFDNTGGKYKVFIVHFYGKQCPACVEAEPVIEELSRMYFQEKRIKFGSLDCDRYSDLCSSSGAFSLPAWLAWLQGEPHSKHYNRDKTVEAFTKWVRQYTGIWPSQLENNLLYQSKEEFSAMRKRTSPMFIIADTPRMEESQELHHIARAIEKKTKRGLRFAAIDKNEHKEFLSKIIGDDMFAGILYSRGKWTKYTGEISENGLLEFFRPLNLVLATPTPTPEPLPDLDEMYDDEYVPNDDEYQHEI